MRESLQLHAGLLFLFLQASTSAQARRPSAAARSTWYLRLGGALCRRSILEGCVRHFSEGRQRNRFKDLERVKQRHPQLLCLGIDESTAVVVRGTSLEVMGLGKVAVYDMIAAGSEMPPPTTLSAGDRYDLRTLARIE